MDEAVLPEGFLSFEPSAIADSGRIYGTLCGPAPCSPFVGVYRDGEVTALHQGFVNTANNRGKIGGGVVDMGPPQAALFTRREVDLIPRLPDEFLSQVTLLTDSGIAFVESVDLSGNLTPYLTRRGHVTPLNFGPDPVRDVDINDRGIVSGTSLRLGSNRAFRYDPFSGTFTLLEPLPTEPESWGQAINNRGHVLGYSFELNGSERIGVWRGTEFHTYFVQGTQEVPTRSNRLLWNERGLIVVTDTDPADLNSYLVPRPGVRLNLADLTEGPLPPWTLIRAINNRGDLLGEGGDEQGVATSNFLLRRVGRLNSEFGKRHTAKSGDLSEE